MEKLHIEKCLADLHSKVIANGMGEEEYQVEKGLNKQFSELLAREEIYWCQKSQDTWLKEGDRNTKFFHNSVKVKRSQNKIYSNKDSCGNTLQTAAEINREAIRYFSNIFLCDPANVETDLDILEVIPNCITAAQNAMLTCPVSKEEVKKALFGLGEEKTLGPDGFPAFFQKFWDILDSDIWKVVEECRAESFILKDFNSTFITLIPKNAESSTSEDYRPISLCNTMYKIITKVIANRLKGVLEMPRKYLGILLFGGACRAKL